MKMSDPYDKAGPANQGKPKRIERDIEAVVRSMQTEFARALPERMNEMERAVENVIAECTAEHLHAASMLAHKLHGTTGSYGFEELARSFRALEKAITTVQEASAQKPSQWLSSEEPLRISLTNALIKCKDQISHICK